MNLTPGLDALHDLIAGTKIPPESKIPEDFGTADLFLADRSALRVKGANRVQLLRDGHHVDLLILIVGYPQEIGYKDPEYSEIDHLEDASYVVLWRQATDLECAAWTMDAPPAEVPLHAWEILQIESRVPGHIILVRTQNIQNFIAHY